MRCHRFPGIPASPAGLPEEAAEGVAGGSHIRQVAFLTNGIDGRYLIPAAVQPLPAEIRKSIAKTCTLKQPECCPPKKRSQKLKQCRGTGPLHFIKQESEEPL